MSTPTELYDEYKRIVDAGNEAAAQKFLADHLAEFPEETRNEILFALFEKAVSSKVAEEEADIALKQAGLETIKALEKELKDVDNQIRIEELKEGLGAK